MSIQRIREMNDAVMLVGCPRCGVTVGRSCVTASGVRYDGRSGASFFCHAARKRALAELDVPLATHALPRQEQKQ